MVVDKPRRPLGITVLGDFIVAEGPAAIVDNLLRVHVEGKVPKFVTVKLTGIRAGRSEIRFPKHTEDQMLKNNRFWDQAR